MDGKKRIFRRRALSSTLRRARGGETTSIARMTIAPRLDVARTRVSRVASTSRRSIRTRVWRPVRENVSAVVDPAFDAALEDDGENDGLGPSSPAVAVAAHLRSESGAQREAMARGGALGPAPPSRRIRSDADAVDAAETLRRDGAVFLKDVCSHEACDEVMNALNEVCDSVEATYGAALRRTDVKLGFDGATRTLVSQACGEGGVRSILSRVDDATSEAVMVEMSVLATEKGADRQVLHPDVSFDAPHAPLYSLFIALQDVIPEMGPTCFVLGTHDRASHDTFPMTKWGDEQFAALVEKKCCDATLRKGDAVLYDARTFHQGGANEYGRRALLTLTFLKPPIPTAPTRRNANAEWSVRDDVFDARWTLDDIVRG